MNTNVAMKYIVSRLKDQPKVSSTKLIVIGTPEECSEVSMNALEIMNASTGERIVILDSWMNDNNDLFIEVYDTAERSNFYIGEAHYSSNHGLKNI